MSVPSLQMIPTLLNETLYKKVYKHMGDTGKRKNFM
jgi:hypothetical protein